MKEKKFAKAGKKMAETEKKMTAKLTKNVPKLKKREIVKRALTKWPKLNVVQKMQLYFVQFFLVV